MKKTLIYLTFALCLVSFFSLTAFASEPDYVIDMQAHNSYGWIDTPIALGPYDVDVYIAGEFVSSFFVDISSSYFYFSTSLTYDNVDFVFNFNTFPDHSEAYLIDPSSDASPSLPGNVVFYFSKSAVTFSGIGEFFTQSVTWLGDVLDVIVQEPALLVMAIVMPVVGFVVSFGKRFIS